MEHFFDTEFWIVASNLALVAATGWVGLLTVREGHRHEEVETHAADERERDLTKIVHEVLEAEKHDHDEDNAGTPA